MEKWTEVETITRRLKIELWFDLDIFCEVCGAVTKNSVTFVVDGYETEICPDCLRKIADRLDKGV